MNEIHQHLVAGLFLWSLLSLGGATVGLYTRDSEFWRSFWFMTGLWGLVDGGIAWYVLVRPPLPPAELAPILHVNCRLDLLYILTAVFLMTRAAPRLRGFGLAILIQGTFLLAFDVFFWRRCAAIE